MKNLIKEFKELLEEQEEIPKDELRDHYLVPCKALLASNPQIVNMIYEDQSLLMMVVKKIVKHNSHPIRTNSLEMLSWDIIEQTKSELINYQDKEGNSVIHLTCMMESFSVGILDLMQSKGASFSLINKKGETPLMLVADSNSLDDLKFIHAYTEKKLINIKDNNGFTALMRAVKGKKINNIFFLLENGADIFVQDSNGRSIVDWLNAKEHHKKANQKFWTEVEILLSSFIKKNFIKQEKL
jgi:ankyrin repeat protein